MRYKNIVFDVGGVLMSYRWLEHIMDTIHDEDRARDFAHRLFDDPLWLEFDIELRPFDDVVEDYVKKYPEDEKHIRYVLGHLEGMPLPRPGVWEKVHELKKAGYRIYLLSNYSSRMFHTHTDGLPFHDDVDGRVISFEVHHLKPHREIYEDLFEKYGLDPGECLFFDDRQENVDGGRKCGMEGRVIYSEEVLLGYLDRLLAPDGISNPFHDPALSRKDRINWLLGSMTLEEKMMLYSHPEQGVGRFGVEGFVLGGEASHGAEERNEQNGIGESNVTTSFPNPVGMSASWDPDLIYEAGRTVGREARACFNKHRRTGLCRWVPTIDLERDPRWGRNEEGYGEDPHLTSVNSCAFIRGMRGEDPDYVMCGATLKHFYANNLENERFFTNSSVSMRDKEDYYLKPFKAALEKAGPLGVMTAYNRINGEVGMTNPEVKTLLKDRYGVTHVVCDGFAMVRLKDYHHEYGTLAECVTASIRAGVDSMSDKPEDVEKAIRDAMEMSLLKESELDEALRNILMVGMKLGIYDPEGSSPYDSIPAGDCDTEESRDICRRLSEESVVLLENRDGTLPLDRDRVQDIALIGPLADEWYADWYAGVRPFSHTVCDGISSVTGCGITPHNGLDTYRILMDGRAWYIEGDGSISLSSPEEGDLFYVEDWNDGNYTVRSVSSGKYVQSCFYGLPDEERGYLKADKDNVFDWFVTCRFRMTENDDGSYSMRDRFANPVSVDGGGRLRAGKGMPEYRISKEKVSDGTEEALKAAGDRSTVILALGCNPMISAREDIDRKSMSLPSDQQKLLDAFIQSGKKLAVVLIANYPYVMGEARKKVDAMLLSASGSEYMGDAIAAALFGQKAPAGRLVQNWPVSEDVLPDMDDYRINGSRTYRYVPKEKVMYPFGYGLSYGEIGYSDMKLTCDGRMLHISLDLENKGKTATDEVVQIYATAEPTDEKLSGASYGRRLVAFVREKDLRPGEIRSVHLEAETDTLKVYDVVRREHILPGGHYHIYAGRNAYDEELFRDIDLEGEPFAVRDLSRMIPVYACDEYENAEFEKGSLNMTAVTSGHDAGRGAGLTFEKCRLPEKAKAVSMILKSKTRGRVELIWNGEVLADWNGNTSATERAYTTYETPTEDTVMPRSWDAVWTEVECEVSSMPGVSEKEGPAAACGTLTVRIDGDVRLLSLKVICEGSQNIHI